jgi:hypothetical protein
MKLPSNTVSTGSRFFFLLCLLLLAAPLYAAGFDEEVSTDEYLFAKGIVQSISVKERTVTLKQLKGPKISFTLDEASVFEGFYHLDELKIRQKLKIWYRPGKQGNRALKILKPLDLGC